MLSMKFPHLFLRNHYLFVGMGVEWGAGATLLSAEFWFTNNEVHVYKQMLYRDIWMETLM